MTGRLAIGAALVGLAWVIVTTRRRAEAELAPLRWQRHLDLQRMARDMAAWSERRAA